MLSRATTFDRRQRVLKLLQEEPGIRVPEIAQLLGVSEGTVRNDLNALADAGQLARVRGGAVPTAEHPGQSAAFMARQQQRQSAKHNVARWAADLVEDGDAILLDASTTVYGIAQYLKERQRLTIVTNGVEVARKLAQNPGNTVILLGGVLRGDGVPVTSTLSDQAPGDLHIKTAFVSCSGFSPEAGLTETDIHEAQLKSHMIGMADSVVALVDSGKVGRVDLAPFARVDQIDRVFVDSLLDPAWVERLRASCSVLTLCDEHGVTDYAHHARECRHYRIGFANLDEQSPFPVDVRRGLERAAREMGSIDLVLADNQLSRAGALQAADRLIASQVDLAIEYQVDAGAADLIMARFRSANIPVIAVDIPMVGATFFGVDNYLAGHMGGVALGQWLQAHWQSRFDRLIILEETRAGPLPAARLRGQIEGLISVVGDVPAEAVLRIDSGNTTEVSQSNTLQLVQGLPASYHLAFICFNDDSALGAIAAARELGREHQIVVAGQGADRLARQELRRPGTPLIGSTAYYAERYGKQLLDLALRIVHNEPVPPAVYVEHTFITAENVDQYDADL